MPPGGSIDFVIHNMGLKIMHVSCPCPWSVVVGRGDDLWSHSYERDCGLTHRSSAQIFFMLKNLVIFSACLSIIDILYLHLLISNRLIASNFHIVYYIILHSRNAPNYRKSAMNRLWSIIDRLAVTDYRLWNCNRFPTLYTCLYRMMAIPVCTACRVIPVSYRMMAIPVCTGWWLYLFVQHAGWYRFLTEWWLYLFVQDDGYTCLYSMQGDTGFLQNDGYTCLYRMMPIPVCTVWQFITVTFGKDLYLYSMKIQECGARLKNVKKNVCTASMIIQVCTVIRYLYSMYSNTKPVFMVRCYMHLSPVLLWFLMLIGQLVSDYL